jgi:hypothetical protein
VAKNRVQIIISALDKGVTATFGRVASGVKSVKDSVFSLKGLLAGGLGALGLGVLGKSFLDASRTTENFRIRLGVLLGSVKEGNRLFDEMAKYAAKVPFEYEEIMASATQLAGILKGGVKEIKEWMPLIGDLAAAAGLDIKTTTEQVSRMLSAGAASADLFRERGILAMLGFQAGVSYSADETKKKLMEMWQAPESRFRGATEKLAQGFDGIMSMIADKWFAFRNKLMDSGAFTGLKETFKAINAVLDKAFDSGKVDEWAARIGTAVVDVGRWIITTIPRALLLVLEGAHQVGKSFNGWSMLWSELRIQFAGFMEFLWSNLNRAREATTGLLEAANVGGMFDEQIANSKRIGEEQRLILAAIAEDKAKALRDQQAAIKKQDEQNRAVEGYRKQIGELQTAFNEFVKQVDERIAKEKELASVHTASTNQQISDVDRYIAKLKEAKAAKVELISLDFRGGNYGGSLDGLESAVRQAERTGG